MRKLFLSCALAVSLACSGCSTLSAVTTPSGVEETQTFSRIVIDADAAFITAATTLNELELAGKITGANRVKAEAFRREAYQGLITIRTVAAARRRPDPASFYRALNALQAFIQEFRR